ncbi:MAG: alkaline phosphatase family protein [Syntrophomonadaceae bacterium]|nr:alkaline phosphatase family protein [Syntrophomonadaceae bacterium]
MRCLVICIDALDPKLAEKYNLFKRLHGERGLVWTQSARENKPISSAKSWTCIYTGSTEQELDHLIYVQDRNKSIRSNTVSETGKKTIWSDLSDRGYKVGVLEGLATDIESMPKRPGNFILTGIDRERKWWPQDIDFILPVEKLERTLPYPVGYRTIIGRNIEWEEVPEKELEEKMPDYYFGMSEFIKIRNSYFIPSIRSLCENYSPDFLLVFRYEIDHLCHMQWHEPGKNTILRGYKHMEDFVYQLQHFLKPDHIIIISDHGMGKLKYTYRQQKIIHGVPVDVAAGDAEVIVSCEHEGPGFFLLTGVTSKYAEHNVEDIYDIILGLM